MQKLNNSEFNNLENCLNLDDLNEKLSTNVNNVNNDNNTNCNHVFSINFWWGPRIVLKNEETFEHILKKKKMD